MEASTVVDAVNLDSGLPSSPSNGRGAARILQSRAIRFLQSPVSSLLEYSGIFRVHPEYSDSEAQPGTGNAGVSVQNSGDSELIGGNDAVDAAGNNNSGDSRNNWEVSIRIVGEEDRIGGVSNRENRSVGGPDDGNGNGGGSSSIDENNRGEGSLHQRYDVQQAVRWIEQMPPFWLLLLLVFIRQHLQGFVVIIYSTAVLIKSNDILQKQTALKGERKISILISYSVFFMLHVFGIYWWHRRGDLLYPLLMIPPKAVPPFWHVIFMIVVNDIMAKQTAMVLKLILLMYYKNGRGHSFRRQGQMLTLVEYMLLLYRALLPAPVWYRFFLNKEYGSLFSSLITGLYLTLKLTSVVEKARLLVAALKALSRKEVHYGSYATTEQVNTAGDLCAICQEKMHVPVILRCKHVFCEDCVSEWFERERTCPLCRALVRPADLQSYADGSTSLLFQLF